MSWPMQAQITVERPADDAATARMLRSWFEGAFVAMGGQLRAEASGYLMVYTHTHTSEGITSETTAFSAETWAAFLDELSAVPHSAHLRIPSFTINLWTNEDDEGWLLLSVVFEPPLLDDPAYQRSTLNFIRSFADAWNPAYGEISWDRGSSRTAFENVFGGTWWRTSRTSRELLRGYAWLTICPQEISDRLGGPATLRESGAFAQVESLTNGGCWLLATDDWRDFGPPAAERMFPILAPVLRAREPHPDAKDDPPFHVSRRNAAELQD